MVIDLKQMTLKELEKHLKDVKKAVQSAKARDRRAAQKAAEKAAAEFGFSLSDLTEGSAAASKPKKPKAKKPRKVSPPQFANPDDKAQTWTGKGRQPNWYRAAVEKGVSPDAMRI